MQLQSRLVTVAEEVEVVVDESACWEIYACRVG